MYSARSSAGVSSPLQSQHFLFAKRSATISFVLSSPFAMLR